MLKSPRLLTALLLLFVLGPARPVPIRAASSVKLDPLVQLRATQLTGNSRVIIQAVNGESLGTIRTLIQLVGGTLLRPLPIIDAQTAIVPNVSLTLLAGNSLVAHIALDRMIVGALERTGGTVGAPAVREALGVDGDGIGIAIIDSGVTSSHDDLNSSASGPARVDTFVDLINGRLHGYDDFGHGTHVAGIIAGNGFDSGGARSGIAPRARLTVIKALDASGSGRISDVIGGLGYVFDHRSELNIRVVNLSVGSAVVESYRQDPLTLAARRLVQAGLVVVAAAGNNGRGPNGRTRYAGITAPGNAPWVLTVGASSHMGTIARPDDTIAAFSSRGPGAVDFSAKPDLVAPGVGIESLSDPASAFYTTKSPYLLPGTTATSYLPYLSLSGTSMAAPVVAGAVALMLDANPALTPNQVKAILQFTSETYAGYDPLTQGAGFVNVDGAVRLARMFAKAPLASFSGSPGWSGHLIWGNQMVEGAQLPATIGAWSNSVMWGTDPWESWSSDAATITNVVWGEMCGGANCTATWDSSIVTGTSDSDTVVWGMDNDDTVVWGMNDDDTVVWGMNCTDPSCEPVIWGGQ